MAYTACSYCAVNDMENFKSKDTFASTGKATILIMVACLQERRGYPKCGC